MPFDTISCINNGNFLHLINLDSLGVKTIPRSEIENIYKNLRDGLDNELRDFIDAESFLSAMHPSSSSFCINPLLALSFDCNYSCDYCYQKERKKDNGQLSTDDLLRVDEFYNHYCDHYALPFRYGTFTIIGGEPLLPKNRLVIESIFRKWKNQEFAITTNGTNIEDFFDLLIKYQVRIKVSLDGTRAMHYEKRHTKDSSAYEKTIMGIKRLVNAEIPVTILSVYNPLNYQKYPEFFDEMESCGWLSTPYLNLAFIPEMGRGCDDINMEYLHSANLTFLKLKEFDYRTAYVNARKLVPGAFALEKALYEAKSYNTFYPYRCSLLELPDYSFLPNGDVMLCLQIENQEGRVGRFKPHVEIDFEKIDRLKLRRIDKLEKCLTCKVKILCKGGCAATSVENSGNPYDPYCGIWQHPDFLDYIENVMDYSQVKMEQKHEKNSIDW